LERAGVSERERKRREVSEGGRERQSKEGRETDRVK
jgi:hypothetical protein